MNRRLHSAMESIHYNADGANRGDKGPTLLSPYKMAGFDLSHRVVMAPMTRCRAINHVPQEAHVEYYSQRATPGGLIITEANAVAQEGIGFPNSPGIFTEEQIRGWSRVVEAVHRKGCFIFCQIWHVGRASHAAYQPEGRPPVSSTRRAPSEKWSVLLPDFTRASYSKPRRLQTEEIPQIIRQFRQAAKNAMAAGFDGVEIHAAHGYLIDQFTKDGINDRDDEYGGCVSNRCRLLLEILREVAAEIGEGRTGIRISPIIHHLEATDSNPVGVGLYLAEQFNRLELAYVHVTEPSFTAGGTVENCREDCWWVRRAYKGTLICSGGYDKDKGDAAIRSGYADVISFGRLFISNPDLPLRFALGIGLNRYDRSTFYTDDQVLGFTDYPFYLSSSV